MMVFKRFLVAASFTMLCVLASPSSVLAKDLFTGGTGGIDCSGNTSSSAVCTDHTKTDNPLLGKGGTLTTATNIISFAAGAAAIIIIIIAALQFVTSGSDFSTNSRTDNDIETAKRTIANAVIGLVVIVLAHTAILYVINKL
jgi:type IV secretion system pilin